MAQLIFISFETCHSGQETCAIGPSWLDFFFSFFCVSMWSLRFPVSKKDHLAREGNVKETCVGLARVVPCGSATLGNADECQFLLV